jgi:hypothetical protein
MLPCRQTSHVFCVSERGIKRGAMLLFDDAAAFLRQEQLAECESCITLVAGCITLVAGCITLVAGCITLVAGCITLVAGCITLVAGCITLEVNVSCLTHLSDI